MPIKAQARTILGKKVKRLRQDGLLPGHVYGANVKAENISVKLDDFLPVYNAAGETSLVDLKIGEEKIRPVLIRDVQYNPVNDRPLHVDFYQVDLTEKVTVPVPIVLIGEEPEIVHSGEAVVLQTLNEVEVEALPTDLVEHIEVDIAKLQNVDDAIIIEQLSYDRDKLKVLAGSEEIVVKLAPAVTAEMEQLLAEQEAETQAAAEAVQVEGEVAEAGEEAVEGEEIQPAAEEKTVEEETKTEQQTEES